MKKYSFLILFCLTLFLGIFLRFYKLGAIPNSLDWDEVSWGYNAYSILKTGRDEYGAFMPLSFKAFGDYKQPMYVYLDVPAIKFFGLNAFAVRFPSAFLGSLSIPFVYLLVLQIFKKRPFRKKIAFLSMASFAVSPWSIQFSRVAFEANTGLFFVLVGAWLFLKALHGKNNWLFFAGAFVLSLSCYTYHSEKIFTPIFFIGLCIYGLPYFKIKRKLIFAILAFFLFCNIFWLADSRTTKRGRSVTFTSSQTQILAKSISEAAYDVNHGNRILAKVHDRRLVYLDKYLQNYLLHFDPNFLFVTGDNARHHAPGIGVLYIISLPFIIAGIFFLLSYEFDTSKLVFFWFLLAPAAAALAVDAPNASRSVIFLPTWDIFIAAGIFFLSQLHFFKQKSIIKICIFLLFVVNFIYYVHQYFSHTNTDMSKYWQYGYEQAIEKTRGAKQNIFFTKDLEQPYIFYLFYTKYDPAIYISDGGSSRITQKCFSIDSAYFGDCREKLRTDDIIISSQPQSGAKVIKTISYPNDESAVTIAKKQ